MGRYVGGVIVSLTKENGSVLSFNLRIYIPSVVAVLSCEYCLLLPHYYYHMVRNEPEIQDTPLFKAS